MHTHRPEIDVIAFETSDGTWIAQGVQHDIVARALQIHGALGISNEMPFASWLIESFHMGLADGATEVHKATLARQGVAATTPSEALFPAYSLWQRRADAHEKYADVLGIDEVVGHLGSLVTKKPVSA